MVAPAIDFTMQKNWTKWAKVANSIKLKSIYKRD
jgi:hypothetical protein